MNTEKKREYDTNPINKARAKERRAERAKSPIFKAKRREYENRPEVVERRNKMLSSPEYKQRASEKRAANIANLLKQVYDIYGWKCACCGEDNVSFLSIDHINGGGKAEIDGINNTYKYYKKVIEENDKTKYQILCFNCNFGRASRGIDGICPHKLPHNWRYNNESS